MAGFVECLESEEAEEGAEKVDGEGKYLVGICTHAVSVLQQQSLSLPMLSNSKYYLFKWPDLTDSGPQKVARIRHETQVHILNLLITSLELKTPNLALYLLGYEVKKPVSSTTLQDPGQNYSSALCTIVALRQSLFSDWIIMLNRCVGLSPELPACHFESATKRHGEEVRTCTRTTGTSPGWTLLPG